MATPPKALCPPPSHRRGFSSGLVTVALHLRDRFFPGETAELAGVKNCAGSFPARRVQP